MSVKKLCKTFIIDGRICNVIRNVDLSVNSGEMVAVMGPSGSGKTTLLYCISGLDTVTAGRVVFSGKDLADFEKREMSDFRLEQMGFIFQQMYTLKNMSLYDNIIMPGYESKEGRTKQGREKINIRATGLMQKMGIIDEAENMVTEVSGGELQRACICRSLINDPKILFADEPTGSLNRQASMGVMTELNRINMEGTTVCLVTHDIKVALRCERILYIDDGAIKEEYKAGKYSETENNMEREIKLNNWLMKMGW